MANLLLDKIKKQASSFILEKYKDARVILTDVTEAELLAEEATNDEPGSPDAKTLTRIAEASYDLHDYCKIVDVLNRRLHSTDWKQWRQAYKSLVLLDFLLTHGPEDFAEEFDANIEVIQELASFKHKDDKGIDWGIRMQKISERVLELLQGGDKLKQARLKALRITNEIQGFGNSDTSPSSSSSPSPSSSLPSDFGAYSPLSSTTSGTISSAYSSSISEVNEEPHSSPKNTNNNNNSSPKDTKINSCGEIEEVKESNDSTLEANCPVQETDFLLEDGEEKSARSLMSGMWSKLCLSPRGNYSNKFDFKSLPSYARKKDARLSRQFSIG